MTGKICGLHIRYDVATKCEVVSKILNTTYTNQEQLVAFIKEQAVALHVNYLTIRTWLGMYGDCYQLGMQLPKGVMSHSFTTINTKTDLNQAYKDLAKIKEQLESVKLNREKINHPQYARPKKKQTSTQILSGLFAELDKVK